jgi:hypothetical protein
MRPALVLSLLALAVLSWVLLQTPHRTPEPPATPVVVADESGRLQEQSQARQQRKEFLATQHKNMTLSSRSGGDSCDYNLSHLAGALESYRADHTTYPKALSQLVPDYIDHLPNCPNAGKESYSTGYSTSPYGYKYVLKCNHKHPNYEPPVYQSEKAVIYSASEMAP